LLTCGHLFKRDSEIAFIFENLDVYRKSIDFIDQITSRTPRYPIAARIHRQPIWRAKTLSRIASTGFLTSCVTM